MPQRPPHKCPYPGCSVLLSDSRYCETHDKLVKTHTREKEPLPFYKRQAWRRLRALYLRTHPLCERCGKVADTVHHRRPIADGGSPYAEENLESLCHSCHSRHHAWGKGAPDGAIRP